MNILIAEDDAVSRLILQVTVESLGHSCLAAEDGQQAWQLYQANEIDVVISDWMMPGLDGIELCRLVRRDSRPGYTYFIFLTALGDRDHLLRGVQSGADDYLAKPLNAEELQVRLLVAARLASLHARLAEQTAELERLNSRLYEQGRIDALTGLGNRLRLTEDLQALGNRAERYSENYCAIMVDIDRFKKYNDTYGHLAGDAVLKTVGGTLQANCRQGDMVYRYGGEEFLVILPHQTPATACLVADKLRRAVTALEVSHQANPPLEIITISAGVAALIPGHHGSVYAWLEDADNALYQAKQSGRNRVKLHETESGVLAS